MRIQDHLALVLKSFKRRRIRGLLTIIGIVIGIAAVVALISVSQGLEEAVREQFETLGTNKIMISPGGDTGTMSMGMLATSKLTDDDIDVIDGVQGVDIVSGMLYASARVKYKDETKYTFVIGLPLDEQQKKLFEEMSNFKADKGDLIKEGAKYDANIGWIIANDKFFEKNVDIRDKILIEGKEFSVVGSIVKIGNRQDDAQVYIPIDTAREIFNKPDEYDMLVVQIKDGYDVDKVAEKIKKELRNSRDEEEGEETFQLQTFEQILEQVGTILGILKAVLVSIAAISLLVGGIGVMNTMYTSVLERTREIGTMKAIGAKTSDIMNLFLVESGLYGLIGGAIGVALGLGIAKIAEFAAAQSLGSTLIHASFAWWLIVGALAFSFIIGCISGIAPARNAARLRPVEALRYE
jgi:putative ABC transport system permease protein